MKNMMANFFSFNLGRGVVSVLRGGMARDKAELKLCLNNFSAKI
jgi:hypothetical protein